MNGELETGAYKPEAAGSREVIVDVCETALLAALIGVSGSFKIPRISTGGRSFNYRRLSPLPFAASSVLRNTSLQGCWRLY